MSKIECKQTQRETFEHLAHSLETIDDIFRQSADNAINKHVTCRNWLNGYYIVHYEQNGSDRAKYGARLLQNLSERLNKQGYSYRDLRLYRQFYLEFGQLSQPIRDYLRTSLSNWQSPIASLIGSESQSKGIWQSPIAKSEESVAQGELAVSADLIFNRLSYTHIVQLLPINDALERTFYEIECIRGTWSTRELKRQIQSGYYIRTGLSSNKDAMRVLANTNAMRGNLTETIKSPFVFEFLGLSGKEVVEESQLETALIDHLQEFMLELGNGFCFEARQKRILVDEDYYFIDLLFYNRLARFGVIIELKSHKLNYKDVAQLNMYLAYYRKNLMQDEDNPPIGILLCTEAGQEMVEYATMGIDENLLISKYMLKLPSKEELKAWLHEELRTLTIEEDKR